MSDLATLVAMRRQTKLQSANELVATLLEASPGDVSIQLERCLINLARREDPAAILEDLATHFQSDELAPDDAFRYFFAEAVARQRVGDLTAASRAFDRARKSISEDAPFYLLSDYLLEYGAACQWRGQSAFAVDCYLELLARSFTHDDEVGMGLAWAALGRSYLEAARYSAACNYLELALQAVEQWGLCREATRVKKDLAECLLKDDKNDRAQQVLATLSDAEWHIADEYLKFTFSNLRVLAAFRSQGACDASLIDALQDHCDQQDAWQRAILALTLGEVGAKQDVKLAIKNTTIAQEKFASDALPTYEVAALMQRTELEHACGMFAEAEDSLSRALSLGIELSDPLLLERIYTLRARLNLTTRMTVESGRELGESHEFRGGGYSLIAEIGSGGFGDVFHCYDNLRMRDVAIKRYRLDQLADSKLQKILSQNIQAELESTSRIEHDAVVKVLSFGIDAAERPYVVMPYIAGSTLDDAMRDTADRMTCLKIFAVVCDGLAAAHAAGVAHRDLKPDNILVSDGRPTIVDFGSAALIEGLDDSFLIIGTLRYMSPEHHQGAAPAPTMDIFAIGVMLYEVVVGASPWATQVNLDPDAYAEDYQRWQQALHKHAQGELADITHRALSYSPDDRPSAAAIRDVLQSLTKSSAGLAASGDQTVVV